MRISTLLIILIVTIFSGCGNVLMPYKEKSSCTQGKYNGYCGSVSDVYNITKKKYN